MKRINLLFMAFILASVGMQAATQKTAVNLSMNWKVDGSADVTYNSKTITWADGTTGTGLGQNGLSYNVADYDRLVIKVTSSTCDNVRFRMDDDNEGGDWGCSYIDIPAGTETRTFTIALPATFNEGASRTYSTIKRMWFNSLNVGNIVIDEIYFEKDITGESTKTWFTVSDAAFSLTLWGDTNTKDADNNAFTLAADGNSVGWDYYYSGKLDISNYDRLVVKLKSVSDNKAVHFRVTGMADATTEAPGNYSVELTADNNYTATINLADGITTNSDLGENPATAIDLTMINSLRFWAWAGEVTVTIDEIYLEKDAEVPVTSELTKDDTKTVDGATTYQEVYNVGNTGNTLTVMVNKTADQDGADVAVHGIITATAAKDANDKMIVTLTATPEDGKHAIDGKPVVEIVTTDSDGDQGDLQLAPRRTPGVGNFVTVTDNEDGTYAFELPNANVEVTAKFKRLPDVPVVAPVINYDDAADNKVTLTFGTGEGIEGTDYRNAAKMYYTTDGSDPKSSETRREITAETVIEVTAAMTVIKVVGVEAEFGDFSDVVEQAVSRRSYLNVTKQWVAFCSPNTYSVPTGLKAYTIQSVTMPVDGQNGTVTLKEQSVISKNTPMLIENTTENLATTKFLITAADDVETAADDVCTEFKGVTVNTNLNTTNGSVYYILKDGVFLRVANPGVVKAYNCYLEFASSVSAPRFDIVINGNTTAIKVIYDSNIYDLPIYDLSGRQIVNRKSVNGKLPKGVYLHQGKKVVIK